MEHILIANSGIQFYVCDLKIDLKSNSKQLFHEWFDEDDIQTNLEFAFLLKKSNKIVRMSDLESCRFLDNEGLLKVSEEEVLANPNIKILHNGDLELAEDIFSLRLNDERHSKFKSLIDKWLPIPYFELDVSGNFKKGPYNWVRCKIIPKVENNELNEEIDVSILLAFDTRAIYKEPDLYEECPSFISETEKEKYFKISSNSSNLLDFCSGRNSWIRNYLLNIVHGISDLREINVKAEEYKYSFLATYLMLIDYISKSDVLPVIKLVRDQGVKSVDVEMVIDIGNSRTAAMLIEDGDFTKVKPLQLQNFTNPLKENGKLNRTHNSFDMRIAFQKVSFGEQLLRGSNQFIWPSFVRLGTEAEYLTHQTISLADGDEVLSTYSSPKRYLWDEKPRSEEWRCVKLSSGKNEIPLIEGINNFLNDDGSVNIDGFGVGLHFSRKSLMTFAFMEIVNQAIGQINSYDYRNFHGNISSPRNISKIILTCPTAMSKKEQISLHRSLKDALLVLNKFHSNVNDDNVASLNIKIIPELDINDEQFKWIFDEATCSQFVYLYSQFTEKYLNYSSDFFELYGHKIDEKSLERELTIGSLDIGAGTSDIMICNYRYNDMNKSRLKPLPIFWDSFDFAGDDMMKVLIENILIQGDNGLLAKELEKRGKSAIEINKILYYFFGEDNNKLSFEDRVLRRDFNLQVCVPVINYFLELLSKDEKYREIGFDDIFKINKPNDLVLNRFERYFGFPLNSIKWIYEERIMSSTIEHTMNNLLENVATLMYAYKCDLVILSGRPTSLKPIKDIFLKYFSVSPNRLIVLNKYRIGRWFPFADEFGYLTNSKSVVPMGAMIGYLASNTGGLNGFSLDLSELGAKLKPTTEYFVLKDYLVNKNNCFISPSKNSGTLTVNTFPVYIGAKQFDLQSYPTRPFYVLDIDKLAIAERIAKSNPLITEAEKQSQVLKQVDNLMVKSPLKFIFEREDYQENKEVLSINSIIGNDGEDVSPINFSLSIQSLNDPECYWLDSGEFNINIKFMQ